MSCFDSGGTDMQQMSTLSKGQNDLLKQMTSLLSGQVGTGITGYGGQMVAPLNQYQQQGINTGQMGLGNFQNFLQGYNPQQGQNYLNQAQPAMNSMLANFDPAAATQFWNQSLVNPAMRNFNQNILPSITERYARGGNDAGAFNRAVVRGGTDLSSGLNEQLGSLLYSGQQAQLGRQQTGINQAMGMAQMPGQLAQQYGDFTGSVGNIGNQAVQLGGQNQNYQQQLLNAAYQQWQQQQGYNNPWLQNYYSQTMGIPAFENVAMGQPMGLGSSAALAGIGALGSFAGGKAASGQW